MLGGRETVDVREERQQEGLPRRRQADLISLEDGMAPTVHATSQEMRHYSPLLPGPRESAHVSGSGV